MKKTMKRLLALGMTLSIAVGMFPVTALAADDMPDSYDFRNATDVKTSWNVVREDPSEKYTWSVGANGLTLKTHNGDIHTGSNNAKNVFVQNAVATDNWVAETMITLDDGFDGYYQQGAIMAYNNDGNYVKLSYEFNPGTAGGGKNMIVQLASEVGEAMQPDSPVNRDLQMFDAGTVVYLQLTKSGSTYSAKYSTDGVDFDPVGGSVTNSMTNPKLALAAINGGVTASEGNPEKTKAVTFAYVASMTAEQAAAVAALETAIKDLPADATTVTGADTDTIAKITDAKKKYDDLSGLALIDTLINQLDRLNDLVDRIADIDKAADVDTLIDAIDDEVTLESKGAIEATREAFDKLDADQKLLVEKKAELEAAEVDYVEALIDDIGTVAATEVCKEKIDAAKAAFGALTDTQKAQVSNKDDLDTADADYNDKKAVSDAEKLINAIDSSITMSSESAINAAKEAFDALTDEQEAAVSSSAKTALDNAEDVLAVVKKINDIDAKITMSSETKIKDARTAFNALDPNTLESRVGNRSDLTNAEDVFNVVKKIDDIGTVSLSSKDKIAAARSAFNALNPNTLEDKVGNSSILVNAEIDYVKALINDIGTVTLDSKAKIEAARAAYNNLTSGQKTAVGSTIYAKLTAAEAALADLTAADAVDAKIDAIGTVAATAACKAKIDAARTAYNALTTEQKALVKKYDDLLNAEELYALLTALGNVCDGGTGCPAFLLTDVDPDQWYHKAVDYVLTEGLFKGVSATQFSPNGTMTRAMIWTVLARMDNATLATTDPWYASAQRWAVYNQVSDGTTPDGSVTREQLVTMLWRFMDEPQANGSLAGYPDAGKVSSWAKEAMTWAVANGVVNGVSNANGTVTLNPGATATRAQVAQMFMNFLNK